MAQTRMFVDTGVLIMAFRGPEPVATAAQQILADTDIDLTTSDFVRLELLPKPVCYGKTTEQEFYEEQLSNFAECVPASRSLVLMAHREAELVGSGCSACCSREGLRLHRNGHE